MSRNIRPNRGAGAYQPPSASRYEEYEDDYPASSRYLSRDRDPAPPPASRPAAVLGRGQQDYGGGRYGQTLSTGSTASTTSSSGSSLLDRMKVKSYESSARTSLDDDRDTPRQNNPTWARKPGALRNQIREEREEVAPANDPRSAGNTLWGRVVSAAESLTVNVSKAWESGPGDGPETPPGGESRLTKAMKDYYIQRARSPLDLPHWLFEEHERMPTTRQAPRETRNDGASRRGRYEEYDADQGSSPPPRGGILRDVYDRAAAQPTRTTPLANRSTPVSQGYESSPATTESKATARLRALRDAKRAQGAGAGGATYSNRYDEDYSANDGGRRSMEPVTDTERRTPASRVGLPGRPGASRYS